MATTCCISDELGEALGPGDLPKGPWLGRAWVSPMPQSNVTGRQEMIQCFMEAKGGTQHLLEEPPVPLRIRPKRETAEAWGLRRWPAQCLQAGRCWGAVEFLTSHSRLTLELEGAALWQEGCVDGGSLRAAWKWLHGWLVSNTPSPSDTSATEDRDWSWNISDLMISLEAI